MPMTVYLNIISNKQHQQPKFQNAVKLSETHSQIHNCKFNYMINIFLTSSGTPDENINKSSSETPFIKKYKNREYTVSTVQILLVIFTISQYLSDCQLPFYFQLSF